LEKFPPLDLRKAATTIDRIGKGRLLYRLVPMFLIVHAVIFAQLARAGRGAEASQPLS